MNQLIKWWWWWFLLSIMPMMITLLPKHKIASSKSRVITDVSNGKLSTIKFLWCQKIGSFIKKESVYFQKSTAPPRGLQTFPTGTYECGQYLFCWMGIHWAEEAPFGELSRSLCYPDFSLPLGYSFCMNYVLSPSTKSCKNNTKHTLEYFIWDWAKRRSVSQKYQFQLLEYLRFIP